MKWIEQLDLEVKVYNRLKKAGISTTDDLLEALYSREVKVSAPNAKKCEEALKAAGIIKYMRGDYVTEDDIEPEPLTWDKLHDYIGKLVVFDCSTESRRCLKVNWIYDMQDDGAGTVTYSDGGRNYSYNSRLTVNRDFKRDPEFLKKHEYLKYEGRFFALKSEEVKTVPETQVMSADYTKAVTLTKKIKANAAAAQESLWEVCKGLKEMHDGKLYKELGYQNFEEYSEREVGIKHSQAYKYVSIAALENVHSSGQIEQIGITKLALLAKLDEPQREEIQQTTDLENTSVKELKEKIADLEKNKSKLIDDLKNAYEERDKERGYREELVDENNILSDRISDLLADKDEAKDTIKSLEQQIEELEDRPVEVAVQANDAEIDKLTAQFQEELAKRDKDTERRLEEQRLRHVEEMKQQREQLEKEAEAADVEVEEEIREKAELEMQVRYVTDAMRKLAKWLFANDPVGENGYRHYAATNIDTVLKIINQEEK